MFADLEPVVGVEQGRARPCVVVSNPEAVRQSRARPIYTIVPLTRSHTLLGPLAPRIGRRQGGLAADGVALVMHVRSIDPERISGRTRGILEAEEMARVESGLEVLLRLGGRSGAGKSAP